MKVDKSLEEVWKWKDAVYEETKNMSISERISYSRKNAEELKEKYNLHLCKAESPTKRLTK